MIECKNHKKPVGIDKVEAFSKKLEDVGGSNGVIISSQGFDEGAKAIARDNFITLLSYRDAELVDWQKVFSSDAWMGFVSFSMESLQVEVLCKNALKKNIFPEDFLFDSSGNDQILAKEFIELFINEYLPQTPLGRFWGEIRPDKPDLYIQADSQFLPIELFRIEFIKKALSHIINLKLASGDILENVIEENRPVYRQFVTESFDWAEIFRSKQGREITQDELDQLQVSNNVINGLVDLRNAERYLGIVLTNQNE